MLLLQAPAGKGLAGTAPADKGHVISLSTDLLRPLMSPVSRFLDDADPYAAGGPGAD